jgi:hypothetical protein
MNPGSKSDHQTRNCRDAHTKRGERGSYPLLFAQLGEAVERCRDVDLVEETLHVTHYGEWRAPIPCLDDDKVEEDSHRQGGVGGFHVPPVLGMLNSCMH